MVVRICIIPLYLLLYFVHVESGSINLLEFLLKAADSIIANPFAERGPIVFNYPLWGPLFHLAILMLGMWSFTNRKIPMRNYFIAAGFLLFYLVLYTNKFLFIPGTVHPYEAAGKFLGLFNRWFFYGLIYTLLVTIFGLSFIYRNKQSNYQVIRTVSVITVQVLLAFIIPFILFLTIGKDFYPSYFWPLEQKYLYPDVITSFPPFFLWYSVIGSLVVFPILALTAGKRFYCSWVCGCGGLAETLGDRWRHLSDKSTGAWKFEKFAIYPVLGLIIALTGLIATTWFMAKSGISVPSIITAIQNETRDFYGYFVKFTLAGAAGVGFYAVLGNRVWCRFFCPMAAMLGILQKGGMFRITVKDNMCISCGNCSTYCEMGIDVRSYAQQNRSFTRASCVGCGICAHVCPRGVLKLESKVPFAKK